MNSKHSSNWQNISVSSPKQRNDVEGVIWIGCWENIGLSHWICSCHVVRRLKRHTFENAHWRKATQYIIHVLHTMEKSPKIHNTCITYSGEKPHNTWYMCRTGFAPATLSGDQSVIRLCDAYLLLCSNELMCQMKFFFRQSKHQLPALIWLCKGGFTEENVPNVCLVFWHRQWAAGRMASRTKKKASEKFPTVAMLRFWAGLQNLQ